LRFEALEALSVKVLTHLRGNSFSLLEIYQLSKEPALPERRYKLVQHKKSRHGRWYYSSYISFTNITKWRLNHLEITNKMRPCI